MVNSFFWRALLLSDSNQNINMVQTKHPLFWVNPLGTQNSFEEAEFHIKEEPVQVGAPCRPHT